MATTIHNHVTELDDDLEARILEVRMMKCEDHKNYFHRRLYDDVVRTVLETNGMTMRQARAPLRKALVSS